MKLDRITKAMTDTAWGTLFINSGRVMPLSFKKQTYECLALMNASASEEEMERGESSKAKAEGQEEGSDPVRYPGKSLL
jgi:hypothetical protein